MQDGHHLGLYSVANMNKLQYRNEYTHTERERAPTVYQMLKRHLSMQIHTHATTTIKTKMFRLLGDIRSVKQNNITSLISLILGSWFEIQNLNKFIIQVITFGVNVFRFSVYL